MVRSSTKNINYPYFDSRIGAPLLNGEFFHKVTQSKRSCATLAKVVQERLQRILGDKSSLLSDWLDKAVGDIQLPFPYNI